MHVIMRLKRVHLLGNEYGKASQPALRANTMEYMEFCKHHFNASLHSQNKISLVASSAMSSVLIVKFNIERCARCLRASIRTTALVDTFFDAAVSSDYLLLGVEINPGRSYAVCREHTNTG